MVSDFEFEKALCSSDPTTSLRAIAQARLDRGASVQSIVDEFERLRERLRNENREAEEDAVMDVMDCLIGWCGPAARLNTSSDLGNGQG